MFLCTDPTLTLSNLTQLLNNVEDWDQFHKHAHIPNAMYEAIKKEHSNGAKQKKALCEWYLAHNPAPSWKHVAVGLYLSEEHAILDVLRMHYLKGQYTPCVV